VEPKRSDFSRAPDISEVHWIFIPPAVRRGTDSCIVGGLFEQRRTLASPLDLAGDAQTNRALGCHRSEIDSMKIEEDQGRSVLFWLKARNE